MKLQLIAATLLAAAATSAAAQTYNIEPNHTYPSFEADHMGISVLRGKFTKTSGTIVLDKAAKTGKVDITIDPATIDFGHAKLNEHVKSPDMLDVAKFPAATYKSTGMSYNGDVPATIDGELTLHGVTKPVKLTINKFKCIIHPRLKREICGADASGTFSRADFGINFGLPAFSPEVKLAIEVEAIKAE
jgi:polyisoprenoid-binding protein YceI